MMDFETSLSAFFTLFKVSNRINFLRDINYDTNWVVIMQTGKNALYICYLYNDGQKSLKLHDVIETNSWK